MNIHNLDKLLPEEKKELRDLMQAWESARKEKDWIKADLLRSRVALWDTTLSLNDGDFWPQFEHNLNRQRRACLRMQIYGVRIYPFE